jgi:hypothetical protein
MLLMNYTLNGCQNCLQLCDENISKGNSSKVSDIEICKLKKFNNFRKIQRILTNE